MNSNTIRYVFTWKQFVPDCRAYKPSAPLIETNELVGVDVPLTHEFILNSAEIIQAQITSGNVEVPKPILTPLGMRFCIDKFEQVMVNPDNTSTDAESSEWDEGDEEEAPKAPAAKKPAVEDEEWEDAPSGDTATKKDVDWDESWEV